MGQTTLRMGEACMCSLISIYVQTVEACRLRRQDSLPQYFEMFASLLLRRQAGSTLESMVDGVGKPM